MAGKGAVLASRILNEIASLGVVVTRVESAWKAAAAKDDELYFDSVALNIHSFYSGLERLFEKISYAVDGYMPKGVNWHQELLNQMALEIPTVRPAVISEKTLKKLDNYRGFRHHTMQTIETISTITTLSQPKCSDVKGVPLMFWTGMIARTRPTQQPDRNCHSIYATMQLRSQKDNYRDH